MSCHEEREREREREMRGGEIETACVDCGAYIAGGVRILRCPDCKDEFVVVDARQRYAEHLARRKAMQGWV